MTIGTVIRVTKLVHFNGQFAQYVDAVAGIMYEARRIRGRWYITGNYVYL